MAVLAGALLVGSSVRASLRGLALERLGDVDQVVTSAAFVREELAVELLARDGMQDAFAGAVPIVAVEGFVTHQDSGRRASAIQVYGVDDRFWAFHGQAGDIETPARNRVLVSEGLANELAAEVDQALLVRVEKPSDVPISSLHGRRSDIGRTLRLQIARVLPPDALGEFSFRPQQGRARSVFVSLTRLQRELEQAGRVNTILLRAADGRGRPPISGWPTAEGGRARCDGHWRISGCGSCRSRPAACTGRRGCGRSDQRRHGGCRHGDGRRSGAAGATHPDLPGEPDSVGRPRDAVLADYGASICAR